MTAWEFGSSLQGAGQAASDLQPHTPSAGPSRGARSAGGASLAATSLARTSATIGGRSAGRVSLPAGRSASGVSLPAGRSARRIVSLPVGRSARAVSLPARNMSGEGTSALTRSGETVSGPATTVSRAAKSAAPKSGAAAASPVVLSGEDDEQAPPATATASIERPMEKRREDVFMVFPPMTAAILAQLARQTVCAGSRAAESSRSASDLAGFGPDIVASSMVAGLFHGTSEATAQLAGSGTWWNRHHRGHRQSELHRGPDDFGVRAAGLRPIPRPRTRCVAAEGLARIKGRRCATLSRPA